MGEENGHLQVCECPAQKPLLRNHICIRSNESPMFKAKQALPGEHCDSETACQGGYMSVHAGYRKRNIDHFAVDVLMACVVARVDFHQMVANVCARPLKEL